MACVVLIGCLSILVANEAVALKVYNRTEWGGRQPKNRTPLPNAPLRYIFIHHTDWTEPTSVEQGKTAVRAVQNAHMDTEKWDDIGYSFLVGGDGSIFEGRGWRTQGAHTKDWNHKGYGIAMMGKFSNKQPTKKAMDALNGLIAFARTNNYTVQNYEVKGHRQAFATECPGEALFKLVQKLPRYTPGSPK